MKVADIKRLNKFIDKNSGLDLLAANLLNINTIDSQNWKGFEKFKDQLIGQLKVYQRLLRILPTNDQDLIYSLINAGIHSAIQIASIPKSKFIREYGSLFNKDSELIEKFYQKAVAIRSQILIKHIANIQKAEPYASSSKLKLN